jgi:hypothetical protein
MNERTQCFLLQPNVGRRLQPSSGYKRSSCFANEAIPCYNPSKAESLISNNVGQRPVLLLNALSELCFLKLTTLGKASSEPGKTKLLQK